MDLLDYCYGVWDGKGLDCTVKMDENEMDVPKTSLPYFLMIFLIDKLHVQ
jgi:hypothetical protein